MYELDICLTMDDVFHENYTRLRELYIPSEHVSINMHDGKLNLILMLDPFIVESRYSAKSKCVKIRETDMDPDRFRAYIDQWKTLKSVEMGIIQMIKYKEEDIDGIRST